MADLKDTDVTGDIEATGKWTGEGAAITGTVLPFAVNTAPVGWLACNGAAVSRTTYADLFAAIGNTFGSGDGSTTFNVPDLRGEFIRGWDDGRGIDSGRSFGSSQSDLIVNHTHSGTTNTDGAHIHSTRLGNDDDQNFTGGVSSGTNRQRPPADAGTRGPGRYPVDTTLSEHNHGFTTGNPSASSGSETRPTNVALLYCIKI